MRQGSRINAGWGWGRAPLIKGNLEIRGAAAPPCPGEVPPGRRGRGRRTIKRRRRGRRRRTIRRRRRRRRRMRSWVCYNYLHGI